MTNQVSRNAKKMIWKILKILYLVVNQQKITNSKKKNENMRNYMRNRRLVHEQKQKEQIYDYERSDAEIATNA